MRNRAWVLAACLLVLAVVILLIPTLEDMRFEPARIMGRSSDVAAPVLLSELHIDENTSLWGLLYLWIALVVPIVLVVLLLPPELRKRILQQVIRFALFVLVLVLALRYRLIHLPDIGTDLSAAGAVGLQTMGGSMESEAFTAPVLPAWVSFLISFVLVALLAVGLYLTLRFWQRAHRPRRSPLDAIAAAARHSLDELAEGRQWGDVVVEAYARMTDAVRSGRGMNRDLSWTPREFASHLARKGLPGSAVEELTRLFEAARYGAATADLNARHRAASCLEAILQACRVGA